MTASHVSFAGRLLLAGLGLSGFTRYAGAAGVTLPVPCLPGACAAPNAAFTGNPAFVSQGSATATQSGNTLTVKQQSNLATLNWQSFNVGAGGKVQFQQPTASSIALNRIYDQKPSSVFGQVTANGQIYLVNPNGFLFGPTAQVNTAGLIASSLQISDANFQAGLLAPQILNSQSQASDAKVAAATASALSNTDLQGTVLYAPGAIQVQAGAQLSAQGGRILLAAPVVDNAGTLSAPDGQVILAAGQQIFLQASTDVSLRGLIVEVDTDGTTTKLNPDGTISANNVAINEPTGVLTADRGNVSMIGLAVNQLGRISATTSVSANGSVRLEAADTVGFSTNSGATAISATHTGTLELGPQSSIELMPDPGSATAAIGAESGTVAQELLLPSSISLLGEQIVFDGGSIVAPNAQLTVAATSTNAPGSVDRPDGVYVSGAANSEAQIRIHAGTTIDLSGSSTELPMSANILSVQLRANEFADDPTQRNGVLRGDTVYIDSRTGTSIVGAPALTAAEATAAYNVDWWTERGGTASFQSEGDIVMSPGASINVSGGKTTYDGGIIQTTKLIGANGQMVDIGAANPLQTYVGIVNPTLTQTFNKWGVTTISPTPGLSSYEAGYVEGTSAGSIQFAAPAMALSGTLLGHAVDGALQRNPLQRDPSTGLCDITLSAAAAACGGTLTLGLPKGLAADITNPTPALEYLTPAITIVSQPTSLTIADGSPLPTQPLQLPVNYLTGGAFQSTQIYGDAAVTLAAGLPLDLLPGSSFAINAPRIDLLSGIHDPSGSITLQSLSTAHSANLTVRPGIEIGTGVTLDVSGKWTNDSLLVGSGVGIGPTLQDAGTVSISLNSQSQDINGAELVVGDQVSLLANGGAWVSSSQALTGGKGGTISILATPTNSALQIGSGVTLGAFGVNGATGGKLNLGAPRLLIEATGGDSWSGPQRVDDLLAPGGVLAINTPLFTDDGFSTINLSATGAVVPGAINANAITVQSGTQINAVSKTLLLDPGYLTQPTDGSIDGFSQLSTLPLFQRSPVNIALAASSVLNASGPMGLIDVESGSLLHTDPGGSLSLTGTGGIYVDGTLSAQGGNITLHIARDTVVDLGYVPTQAIELGPEGTLDVSGTTIMTPSQLNLQLGQVLPAGNIQLLADRGTVIADPGSTLNLAGTSASLDIPQALGSNNYTLQTVGGAGGSLTIHSPEAVQLRGTMRAAAGAGNYGDPAGGSLELDLTQGQAWFLAPEGASTPLPSVPLNIVMSSTAAGASGNPSATGTAVLGVSQLEAAGFDSLHLAAGNEIQLGSSMPMNFARQIVLDAPQIGILGATQATLTTNYLALQDSSSLSLQGLPTGQLLSGSGTLTARAQRIDVSGFVALQGAQSVTLNSAGDVSLLGVLIGSNAPAGSLSTAGNLTIGAARIFPATDTTFQMNAVGSGRTVEIDQTSPAVGTPLSANGSLTINADTIDSKGTLLAPFGQIKLDADTQLTLEPGSLTSISADGATIPYGQTQLGGGQWVYDSIGSGTTVQQNVTGTPARSLQLQAPRVDIQKNATIDLNGGGNTYAYEWVPGTGGTKDALSADPATGGISGLYAIVPSLGSSYAPYDPEESGGTTKAGASIYQPGASVYLSAGSGVAAGTYALMPPRFALLPGAFLVQVQSGYSNIVPGQQAALVDGTPVVAGYQTFGSTGLHSGGYVGVAVWTGGPSAVATATQPASHAQQIAAYTISNAQNFFSAAAATAGLASPDLPNDAGLLTLNVVATALSGSQNCLTQQTVSCLSFAGSLLGSGAGSKGQAAEVDISAAQLEVTGSDSSVTPVPGNVTIAAAEIDSWKAGDLVLGGSLTHYLSSNPGGKPPAGDLLPQQTGLLNLTTVANQVTIDSGAQLQAGQVLITSAQSINVGANASVITDSLANHTAPGIAPSATAVAMVDPNAALLAVSDRALPIALRSVASAGSGSTIPPAGITLEAGSTLGSLGAIVIDTPGTVAISDQSTIKGAGAQWSLASTSLGLLASGDTFTISAPLLTQMQGAGALNLSASQAIDIGGSLHLGSIAPAAAGKPATPTIAVLNIATPQLNLNSQQADFTAGTIILGGANSDMSGTPTAGTGALSLNASKVEFGVGTGSLIVNGATKTSINADAGVVAGATPLYGLEQAAQAATVPATLVELLPAEPRSAVQFSGDVSVTTPVFTADSGVGLQLGVLNGTLTLDAPSASRSAIAASELGGELDFTANTIVQATNITVPSGVVSLQADQGLTVATGAIVDVSGIDVAVGAQTVGAEGGRIALGAGGTLTLASKSTLNVSGAGDAPAGEIQLVAGGEADLGGTLQGRAAQGSHTGQFTLQAGSLAQDLSTLNGTLSTGGMTQLVNIDVAQGDLTLSAGSRLTANQVTLTAESGTVEVAGTIQAPGSDVRGGIGLFGGVGVVLDSTGLLNADSGNASQGGGTIELGAGTNGTVALGNGGVISAAGASGTSDGTLLIRAPLTANGTDVAITDAGTTLNHLGSILVEPVIVELAPANVTAAGFASILADAGTRFGTASANIQTRLSATLPPMQLRAAVDLESNGDLTFAGTGPNAGIDLTDASARIDGQPIDLTVRASGSITVATTISDGFQTVSSVLNGHSQNELELLDDYKSASLRFVAGANPNNPNPLAYVSGSNATLQVGTNTTGAPNGIVRTGTGEIDLVSSGNICFSAQCAVNGQASGEVYTAGLPGVPGTGTGTAQLVNVSSTSSAALNIATGGGNVVVDAGGGIVGGIVPAGEGNASNNGPSVSTWQTRQVATITDTNGDQTTVAQWGVDLNQYTTYGWNVASLGGGDVRVQSNADVTNLSAAAADSSAYLADSAAPTLFRSGGLDVQSNGNIGSASFYAADGSSTLSAGGAFNGVRQGGTATDGTQLFVGSLIALNAAQVNVEARTGVQIDAVVNPTLLAPALSNSAKGLGTSFFTYTDDSALQAQSSTNDVLFGSGSGNLLSLLGNAPSKTAGAYPASLTAAALTGNLEVPTATLFPSDTGQIQLIAGRDINLAPLTMSDLATAGLRTAQNPGGATTIIQTGVPTGRHAADPDPAIIAAGRDINDAGGSQLSLPKAAQITAGRDIIDLIYYGQNLNPGDLTLISAGRNFIDESNNQGVASTVQLGGPGALDVMAGGNIDLGESSGVTTVGSLVNPNLQYSNGASITMIAGLGASPDYAGFFNKVVEATKTYEDQLVSYEEGVTGQSNLTADAAETLFQQPASTQRTVLNDAFLNGIFFQQLETSGQQETTVAGAGFKLGYAAIDALFPNSRTGSATTGPSPYAGNMTLTFSQIYTEAGGDLSLLIPGGSLDVGLANPQGGKLPSQLGIVAEGPGNIDIYAKNDVNVNASRVFTLGGGNILIWSDEGSIDAGQGAKSSLSAPAPLVTVDSSGKVSLNFSGAVAGSGIRTIQVEPTVPPGNVDLVAPVGTVDAGDAGIGASGNINIAAAKVVGVSNINFGGQATGVPAQVSDIGVSLSGASNVAAGSTNSASSSAQDEARRAEEAAAPLAQAVISWLDVFVTGLGEENCKPDDMECLRRQKQENAN